VIFSLQYADNKVMEEKPTKVEGWTAKQIGRILEISYDNARQRISQAEIKALLKEAVYPLDSPDKLRNENPVGWKKGRSRKTGTETSQAKPKKSKK